MDVLSELSKLNALNADGGLNASTGDSKDVLEGIATLVNASLKDRKPVYLDKYSAPCTSLVLLKDNPCEVIYSVDSTNYILCISACKYSFIDGDLSDVYLSLHEFNKLVEIKDSKDVRDMFALLDFIRHLKAEQASIQDSITLYYYGYVEYSAVASLLDVIPNELPSFLASLVDKYKLSFSFVIGDNYTQLIKHRLDIIKKEQGGESSHD